MVKLGRDLGTLLAAVVLASCLHSNGRVVQPREPEPQARDELVSAECKASSSSGGTPFNAAEADGILKYAMERAWNCGLHTMSHFDLGLTLEWGNTGCVASVVLQQELPSAIGECLIRQFEKAAVPAFGGKSPHVEVRMTNDRSWWSVQ
jgi:hypothetical protein